MYLNFMFKIVLPSRIFVFEDDQYKSHAHVEILNFL